MMPSLSLRILGRFSCIRKKKLRGPRQTTDDECTTMINTMTTRNNDTIYSRYSWTSKHYVCLLLTSFLVRPLSVYEIFIGRKVISALAATFHNL